MPPDREVGFGIERCTKKPEMCNLHKPGQATMMLTCDDLPRPVQQMHEQDEEDDIDNLNRRRRELWKELRRHDAPEGYMSDVKIHEEVHVGHSAIQPTIGVRNGNRSLSSQQEVNLADGHSGPPLQIKGFDTPGLEDSHDDDDDHCVNMIKEVLKWGTLSSIVMVSKCRVPPTDIWKKHVGRYWRQYPMMSSQWIFVHTNADPYAVTSIERRKTSSFEEMCQNRITAVMDAMYEVTQDRNFTAGHIFVECDTDDHEVLKGLLSKQHNAFYTMVANHDSIPIRELPFQKGHRLQSIDNILVGNLDAISKTMIATFTDMKEALGPLMQRTLHYAQLHRSKQKQLDSVISELLQKDNDGYQSVTKNVYESMGFFRHPKQTTRLTSLHSVYDVQVVDTSGYNGQYLTCHQTVDDAAHEGSGAKIVTLELKVSVLLTTLRARIVVRSPNAMVFRDRIVQLRIDKKTFEGEVADAQARMVQAEQEVVRVESKATRATLKMQTSIAMMSFLQSEWTVEQFDSMKPFYDEAKMLLVDSPPDRMAADLVLACQGCWQQHHHNGDFEPEALYDATPRHTPYCTPKSTPTQFGSASSLGPGAFDLDSSIDEASQSAPQIIPPTTLSHRHSGQNLSAFGLDRAPMGHFDSQKSNILAWPSPAEAGKPPYSTAQRLSLQSASLMSPLQRSLSSCSQSSGSISASGFPALAEHALRSSGPAQILNPNRAPSAWAPAHEDVEEDRSFSFSI